MIGVFVACRDRACAGLDATRTFDLAATVSGTGVVTLWADELMRALRGPYSVVPTVIDPSLVCRSNTWSEPTSVGTVTLRSPSDVVAETR